MKITAYAALAISLVSVEVFANPDTARSDTVPETRAAETRVAMTEGLNPRHKAPTDQELDELIRKGFAASVRVDRIVVPAFVTDGKGKPVLGLKSQDFRVSEDKVLQKIDFFDLTREGGISLAFLLDLSGSMRLMNKLDEAREAIRYFLNGVGEHDRAGVLTFADGGVETIAPFGTRPDVIMASLLPLKAYGQTALNDAIAMAPTLLGQDDPGRKAIILITDGIDNASSLTLAQATSVARRTDVPVYTLGFATSTVAPSPKQPEAGTNAAVLQQIASETGGDFYWIRDQDDLKDAVIAIEEELRTQYILGYTPQTVRCDGTFRRIDVRVEKDRYTVRTRKGYVPGPC